jgi:hypothetical protein
MGGVSHELCYSVTAPGKPDTWHGLHLDGQAQLPYNECQAWQRSRTLCPLTAAPPHDMPGFGP